MSSIDAAIIKALNDHIESPPVVNIDYNNSIVAYTSPDKGEFFVKENNEIFFRCKDKNFICPRVGDFIKLRSKADGQMRTFVCTSMSTDSTSNTKIYYHFNDVCLNGSIQLINDFNGLEPYFGVKSTKYEIPDGIETGLFSLDISNLSSMLNYIMALCNGINYQLTLYEGRIKTLEKAVENT